MHTKFFYTVLFSLALSQQGHSAAYDLTSEEAAKKLITHAMNGYDRANIITALAAVPAAEVDGFISAAQSLITAAMSGFDRSAIITALAAVPADERDGISSAAQRLITSAMNGFDQSAIITALAAVPVDEREGFIITAETLITDAMGEFITPALSFRLKIIITLAALPAAEREGFSSAAHGLITAAMSGYNRANIITALAAVPAANREGISIAAQRLITRGMQYNCPNHGYDCASTITALARVPAADREVRVTETLRLYGEAEGRGETQGAEGRVMVEILEGTYRSTVHHAVAIPGRAFEVHRYAETQVAGPADAAPKSKRLNQAVLEAIQARLARKQVKMDFAKSFAAVNALAAKIYSGQELENAKTAIATGLEGKHAKKELCQVYAFLKDFHPAALELWARQFIGESITAYEDRRNPTSCIKGIRERIVIGLRGIDPELNKLFGQAERPATMKALLAQSNFGESAANATWMAQKLVELGATRQTTPEDMGQLYKDFLEKTLKEYGVEHNETFEGQAKAYAELIKEDLEAEESHLKPALAAKFAEMKGSASPQLGAVHETLEERRAILAQQDAAYQASLAADEEKERLRAERALAVEPPMSHEEIKRRVAEAAEKRRKQNEGAGPAD